MSLTAKLRGTSESIFQIGLAGQQLKSATDGALEMRDALDSAYVNVRVADPVSDSDAVNLRTLCALIAPDDESAEPSLFGNSSSLFGDDSDGYW